MKTTSAALEDLSTGMSCSIGSARLNASEIVEFARAYDPQPMHTDAVEAIDTPVGGLIASGWHTVATMMRMLVDSRVFGINPILGAGVTDLRWPVPVRPGDELIGSAEIIDIRESKKPDRGVVTLLVTLSNQLGQPVLSLKPSMVVPRRVVSNSP